MNRAMTEKELAAHLRTALATPSGQVLREFLRTHCFMAPGRAPHKLAEVGQEQQIAFRYGRMTLFQMLEFYMDPANVGDRVANPEKE